MKEEQPQKLSPSDTGETKNNNNAQSANQKFKDPAKMSTEEKCTVGDESEWGEFSTCKVADSGVDMSISWCPKKIQNSTINPQMYIRLNRFNLTKKLTIEQGSALLQAWIPGFDPPIFNQTFPDHKCEDIKEKLPATLQLFFHCPLSLELLGRIVKIGEVYNVTNPLPTVLPAGSYHLHAEVDNQDQKDFICIDAWLDFGV